MGLRGTGIVTNCQGCRARLRVPWVECDWAFDKAENALEGAPKEDLKHGLVVMFYCPECGTFNVLDGFLTKDEGEEYDEKDDADEKD